MNKKWDRQLFGRLLKGVLVSLALTQSTTSLKAEPNEAQWMKLLGLAPNLAVDKAKTAAFPPGRIQQSLGIMFQDQAVCGTPSFPDQELAQASPDEIMLHLGVEDREYAEYIPRVHKQMLAATGRGSFPPGCIEEYPNNHAVKYWVDYSSFPESYFGQAVTDRMMQNLINSKVWGVTTITQARNEFDKGSLIKSFLYLGLDRTYQRVGCGHFETTTQNIAQIRIRGRRLPGSLIGYAEFNDGTCTPFVQMTLDTSWRPSAPYIDFGRLTGHEAGHNGNAQHTFAGQRNHRGVMGYTPPDGDVYYGYLTGQEVGISLPRDPAWTHWVRVYGGDPFPIDPRPDPDPEPQPGDGKVVLEVGKEYVLVVEGQNVTLAVTSIDGSEGETLADKIEKTFAAIPNYPQRNQHRQIIAMTYFATAQAVRTGQQVEVAIEALKMTRTLLMGADATRPEWQALFELADSVTTADGLESVAKGLGYTQRMNPYISGEELVILTMNTQAMVENRAISPLILTVMKLMHSFLPEGRLKTALGMIISILEGLPAKDPAQKEAILDFEQGFGPPAPAREDQGSVPGNLSGVRYVLVA